MAFLDITCNSDKKAFNEKNKTFNQKRRYSKGIFVKTYVLENILKNLRSDCVEFI